MNVSNTSAEAVNISSSEPRHLLAASLEIILIVSAILIMLLNCWVSYAVIRKKELRSSVYNRCVLSLSISDMFVGMSILITAFNGRRFYVCMFATTLIYICQSSSMLHILLICVERIFKLKMFSPGSFHVWLAIAWLVSVLVSCVPIPLWSVDKYSITSCSLRIIYDDQYYTYISYMATYFIIVYLSIFVAFVILICLLVKFHFRNRRLVSGISSTNYMSNNSTETTPKPSTSRMTLSAANAPEAPREISGSAPILTVHDSRRIYNRARLPGSLKYREQVKSVATVGVIFAVLTICSLPLFVADLLMVSIDGFSVSIQTKAVFLYVLFMNSAVNPIIYTWRMKGFKEAMFPCQKGQ